MKPLYSSRLRNPFLRSAFLTAAVLALGSAAAQADTHTWDDTINASWFLAGKWSPEWVNGGTSIALVNSGYVYADASVTASSLTIGDGIGSAEAKNLFNNAFAGIGSIIINSNGRLSGGSNTTTHLGSITLNGGTISGSDTGGTAALVGIFNFDDTVHVTADSTISVTGAGVTLGQTGGTQFNVDSGKTLSVTGTIVNKAPYVPDTGLIKTGDGTMNLTSTNTYTGGTTVNAGTLGLTGGGGTGVIRGTLNINNSGTTVQLNSKDAIGVTNTVNVSTVNISGGTITNTGAFNNGYRTNFNLTGGTMSSSSASGRFDFTTGFGITTLASGDFSTVSAWILLRDGNNMPISVADGAAATDLLISGPIGGSPGGEGITKTGDGTMELSGTNTYTGATTVNAGTLKLGANNVIPDSSNVTIGTATIDAATSGTETAGTLDVTAAATINLGTGANLVFAGGGTATWAGSLNITGTFVSGSSLNFGSSSGLTPTQLGLLTVNGGGGPFTLDGSGFLISGGVSGYAAWQSANGTAQAANLDHDHDGVSNGVEHFLGGVANTTGNSNPLPGVINTAGVLSVTWTRHPDFPGFPANYGTAVIVETSATLTDPWTPAVEGVGAGFVEITGNNVKYTFPGGTKDFARLKVVETP